MLYSHTRSLKPSNEDAMYRNSWVSVVGPWPHQTPLNSHPSSLYAIVNVMQDVDIVISVYYCYYDYYIYGNNLTIIAYTYSVCITFVGYNLKILHRSSICICCIINNIPCIIAGMPTWCISIPDFTRRIPAVHYLPLSNRKIKKTSQQTPCCCFTLQKKKKVAYVSVIYYLTWVSLALQSSRVHYVVTTEYKKLKRTRLEHPLTAQSSYQVSWTSVK